jgi:hypothetical protein
MSSGDLAHGRRLRPLQLIYRSHSAASFHHHF